MLSRNEYVGRLPYEEYVKRYKRHEQAIFPSTTDKKPGEDIPPTQEDIKEYLKKSKQDLSEKTKELIKKQIEKKTGNQFKDLEDAVSRLSGEGEEEDKEHKEHFIKGLQLARALQPNTENLTPIERVRAKLTHASKIGYLNDDNFQKAQDYLTQNPDTTGYVIDKKLSNPEGLVIRTPTGETEIHYRSSQFTGTPSKTDLQTNFRIITGFESEDPQFIQAKNQYEQAVNKYGSVEHFSGASKGGGKAIYMGQKYDIPSTTFNPLIGTKTARGITNTTQEHTIIRTTGDPTSLPLAVSSTANHENWNVKALRPLKKNVGLNPIKNAYDAHKHDNFTEPRNPNNVSMDATSLEIYPLKIAGLSSQLQQYQTLNEMKTEYIEKGKSFSDYIFDLQKGNNPNFTGDNDVGLVNGKPLIRGKRHTRGEGRGTGDYWETMGGKFTDEEKNVIINKGDKTPLTLEQLQKEIINAKQTPELLSAEKMKIADLTKQKGIELAKLMRTKKREDMTDSEKELLDKTREEFELLKNKRDTLRSMEQGDIMGDTADLEADFGIPEGLPDIPTTTATDSDFVSVDSDLPNVNTSLSKEQLKKFGSANSEERQGILKDHAEEIINASNEYGEATTPMEVAGFREHFGEAINPVSMGAGMLVGMGVDKALDYIDPADNPDGTKRQQAITGVSREALSGGITGGLMSAGTTALGGTTIGLAPEILAGSAGYVAGAESGKLVASGIKKLGGNQDEQEAGSDILGGAVGGAVGAGTLIGTATLTGAELGSAGGLLGVGIGAGVGLLGGSLAFGVSEITKHKDDIKKGFEDAGKAISNTAKSVGGFFKKLF